jgi:hypothetical protein
LNSETHTASSSKTFYLQETTALIAIFLLNTTFGSSSQPRKLQDGSATEGNQRAKVFPFES